MKMTVKIPYVEQHQPRRGGKVYLRYRRAGKRIAMKAGPNDPVAVIQAEANRIGEQFESGAEYPIGSLGRLIEDYETSNYLPPSPATVASYRRVFAVLQADGAELPEDTQNVIRNLKFGGE